MTNTYGFVTEEDRRREEELLANLRRMADARRQRQAAFEAQDNGRWNPGRTLAQLHAQPTPIRLADRRRRMERMSVAAEALINLQTSPGYQLPEREPEYDASRMRAVDAVVRSEELSTFFANPTNAQLASQDVEQLTLWQHVSDVFRLATAGSNLLRGDAARSAQAARDITSSRTIARSTTAIQRALYRERMAGFGDRMNPESALGEMDVGAPAQRSIPGSILTDWSRIGRERASLPLLTQEEREEYLTYRRDEMLGLTASPGMGEDFGSWLVENLVPTVRALGEIPSGAWSGISAGYERAARNWEMIGNDVTLADTLDRTNAILIGVGDIAVSGVVGALASPVAYTYEQEAGNAFIEFSNYVGEDGQLIDPRIAGAFARDVGTINSMFELVGFAGITKAVGADRFLGFLTRAGVRSAFRRYTMQDGVRRMLMAQAGSALSEGATEAMQETSIVALGHMARLADSGRLDEMTDGEIAAEVWRVIKENSGRIAEAGLAGAIIGGAIGTVGSTLTIGSLIETARTARAQEAIIEALRTNSENSQLRKSAPSVYEKIVSRITRGTPLEQAVINVEDFNAAFQQDTDLARAAARELGVVDQYDEASKSGGDLFLPMGAVQAKIAGTAQYADISRKMRLGPDALSLEEAQARLELGVDVDRAIEVAMQAAQEQSNWDNARAQISAEVYDRLTESETFGADEINKTLSSVFADAYITIARNAGIDIASMPEIPTFIGPFGQTKGVDPDAFRSMAQGREGGGAKFEWDANGLVRAAMIYFTERRNLSTPVHEVFGHYFLEVLRFAAAQPNATAQLKADWQTALEWMGTTDAYWANAVQQSPAAMKAMLAPFHEKFARAAEVYFMTGRAPTPRLRNVFRLLKTWILRAYKSIAGFFDAEGKIINPAYAGLLDERISPVFDRMLATEREIAEAASQMGSNEIMTREQFSSNKDKFADAAYERYKDKIVEARRRAEEAVDAAAMDALIKENDRERRRAERRARKTVEAEMAQDPAWVAHDIIVGQVDLSLAPGIRLNPSMTIEQNPDLAEQLPRGAFDTDVDGMVESAMWARSVRQPMRFGARVQQLGIFDEDGQLEAILGSKKGLRREGDGRDLQDAITQLWDEGWFGERNAAEAFFHTTFTLGQGGIAPVYFSAVERALEQSSLRSAGKDQWLATIKNTPGVTQEEVDLLGVEDWLSTREGSFAKEEVLSFVRNKGPRLQENVLGGRDQSEQEGRLLGELLRLTEENDRLARMRISEGSILEDRARDESIENRMNELRPQIEDLRKALRDYQEKNVTKGGPARWTNFQLSGAIPGTEREIVISFRDIEPFEPTDKVHFSDLSDGRVVVWVRGAEYKLANGRTMFVMSEVQSRRHELGREHGYRTLTDKEIRRLEVVAMEERLEVQFLQSDARKYLIEKERGDELKRAEARVQRARDRLTGGSGALSGSALQFARTNLREAEDALGAIYRTGPSTPAQISKRLQEEAETDERARRFLAEITEAEALAEQKSQEYLLARDHHHRSVPDAPLKNNAWASLALKRMIRWAAENDVELGWVRGERPTEWFDLSRRIGAIRHEKIDEGRYRVKVYDSDGVLRFGSVPEEFTAQELRETFGAELAAKIEANEGRQALSGGREISGIDLRMGGEGMRAFYDKILVNIANGLGKRFGARVGQATVLMPSSASETSAYGPKDYLVEEREEGWIVSQNQSRTPGTPVFATREEAEAQLAKILERFEPTPETVHTLPITDSLRDAVLAGGVPVFGNRIMRRAEDGTFYHAPLDGSASDVRAAYAYASVVGLENAFGSVEGRKIATGRALKVELQERALAASGWDLTNDTPEARAIITEVAINDVLYALRTGGTGAVGWYDRKTRQALSVLALMHPEIKTDPNARFALTWILAVTSNGLRVNKNFEITEKIYREYRQTGVMPTNVGIGLPSAAINSNLALFNQLVGEIGIDDLRRFMLSTFTVREIADATGKAPAGLKPHHVARGAAILGPKIGNGFFSNLYGYFDALTMDRWFVRSWGRWTGGLIVNQTEKVNQTRSALGGAPRAALKRAAKIIGYTGDIADLDALANAINKATAKKELREQLQADAAIDNVRRMARRLVHYLDGQKEQPDGPDERVFMAEVMTEVTRRVRESSPDYATLTVADVQAILWYAEKRLYEKAKVDDAPTEGGVGDVVYEEDEAPDYANAALIVARASGVDEGSIRQALKEVDDAIEEEARGARLAAGGRGPGTRVSGYAGPPADGPYAGSIWRRYQGFAPSEQREFLRRRAIQRSRAFAKGEERSSWRFEFRGDRGGREGGLVKPLGVRALGKWVAPKKYKNLMERSGINVPTILELDPSDPASVAHFRAAILENKAKLPPENAWMVHVYDEGDYAQMRLFMTEDGKSGGALKGQTLVSVFSAGGAGRSVIEVITQAGARDADAFDATTAGRKFGLPALYSSHGYRVVARQPFDPAFSPEDYDPSYGAPDVAYMVYDPQFFGGVEAGDVFSSYDAAVQKQQAEVGKIDAVRQSLGLDESIFYQDETEAMFRAQRQEMLSRIINDVAINQDTAAKIYTGLLADHNQQTARAIRLSLGLDAVPAGGRGRLVTESVAASAQSLFDIMQVREAIARKYGDDFVAAMGVPITMDMADQLVSTQDIEAAIAQRVSQKAAFERDLSKGKVRGVAVDEDALAIAREVVADLTSEIEMLQAERNRRLGEPSGKPWSLDDGRTAINRATDEQILAWVRDSGEVQMARDSYGYYTFRFKTDPSLKNFNARVDFQNKGGRYYATAEYGKYRRTAGLGKRPTKREIETARRFFGAISAITRALIIMERPSEIFFSGGSESHEALYPVMGRTIEFAGYNARIHVTTSGGAKVDDLTSDPSGVHHRVYRAIRFVLLRPDIAAQTPLYDIPPHAVSQEQFVARIGPSHVSPHALRKPGELIWFAEKSEDVRNAQTTHVVRDPRGGTGYSGADPAVRFRPIDVAGFDGDPAAAYSSAVVAAKGAAVRALDEAEGWYNHTPEPPQKGEFYDALRDDVSGVSPRYRVQDTAAALDWAEAERVRAFFARRGIDLRSSPQELRQQIRLAADKLNDTGASPDEMAAAVNAHLGYQAFGSGREMLEAVANLPKRSEHIKARVDEIVRGELGDPLDDMATATRAAMHNIHEEQRIVMELGAIQEATGRGAGRAINRTAQDYARRRVERMSVKEAMNPDWALSGERRWAKAAQEALRRGDADAAQKAKFNQLVHFHLYKEMSRAQVQLERSVVYFRRLQKLSARTRISADYYEQIVGILDDYELRPISQREISRRISLSEWVRSMEERGLGAMVQIDPKIIAAANKKPFSQLTVDEALSVRDAIVNLEHLGKLKDKLLKARDKREFNLVIGELVGQMGQTGPIKKKASREYSQDGNMGARVSSAFRRWHSDLVRFEFLFRYLDGGVANGPLWSTLFKPFAEAADVESAMQHRVAAQLDAAWTKFSRREQRDIFGMKVTVPELAIESDVAGRSDTFVKSELLAIALNLGNDGNVAALVDGFGWFRAPRGLETDYAQAKARIIAVLDKHLTKKDWEFVQRVWDIVGSFRDEAFSLHERLTGIRPEAVEATPVTTKHGTFAGGYYPLKFDPLRDARVERSQADEAKMASEWGPSSFAPMTKKGHLTERVGSGGRPVNLSLTVAEQHINNVIHDIAYREALIDVNRVVSDPSFRAAFIRTVGKELYDQLHPWLHSIAVEKRPLTSDLAKFIGKMRGNMQVAIMGAKVSVAMMQPVGLLQAVPFVGGPRMMATLAKLVADPIALREKADYVMNKSEFMRSRVRSFNRDIREFLTKAKARGGGTLSDVDHAVKKNAFMLIGLMDWAVSSTTWLAAYEQARDGKVKGVAGPMTDEDAVAYADSIVRQTQSAGLNQDLPKLMRSDEVGKLITAFYSYFSVLYNWTTYDLVLGVRKGRVPLPVALGNFFLIYIVAPILSEILAGRWDKDGESEEERMQRILGVVVRGVFSPVPLVRDAANAYDSFFDYRMATFEGGVQAVVDTAESIGDGSIWTNEAAQKRAALAAGFVFGLPLPQVYITGDYIRDYIEGEEQGFDFNEALLRDTR